MQPAATNIIVLLQSLRTVTLRLLQVRPYDADAIMRIQMPPPPLPFSWGRTVQAYVPAELRSQPAAEAMDDDSGAEAAQGPFDRTYQARQMPSCEHTISFLCTWVKCSAEGANELC